MTDATEASSAAGPTTANLPEQRQTAATPAQVWNARLWVLQGTGFALLFAALVLMAGMAIRSGDADAWVARTLEVRQASGAVYSVLQDAEASVRGYLLTDDPRLATRYHLARDSLPAARERLRTLIHDSPLQMARLDMLEPLLQRRMALLAGAVTATRQGDRETVSRQMVQGEGPALMDEIRALLATFDKSEADLQSKRQHQARTAHTDLLLGSSGVLMLALLLGGLTAVLTQRQARALAALNGRLADTVDAKTIALDASEARFRQVFHDSPIGLTIATAQSRRIVSVNPALCRMFGYTEEELIGRTGSEFALGDDAGIVIPVGPAADGPWRPTGRRYLTRAGHLLFARSNFVPLLLPGASQPLILAMTEDITHEKEVEAALRASQDRMRLALEVAQLGAWEHDVPTGRSRLDDRAAAMLGGRLPADTWLDFDGPELTAWEALIHPEDTDARSAADRRLRNAKDSMTSFEFRVRVGKSSWRWIAAVGTVIAPEPDEVRAQRTLTILQDITQRRESEIELRHAHRMEAVGQLTGGVAHDFNNLLGAILGHTEFLLDLLPEQTEARQLASEILDCALNGAALTQRLLAFARRQPLQPAVIDLNEYLPVHVSLLQRTLGETVTVEVALGRDLWLTHADPSQIVDVLLNLAINARDAMPHGGRLTISTTNAVLDATFCVHNPEAVPGEYVALAVADTGTGMPPDVLVRAIEPFFTTKPPGKGSGLGLSMIYGFARQSGGYLSIDSTPGMGTTVRVYLPRTEAEQATAPSQKRQLPPLPRGTESILVVDDNDAMRATAARNLAALGYRVRIASDGPAALALLQGGERFDLLFTDLVMPNGLSGYQLADTARTLRPGLPVLYTSGFAADEDGETAVMDPNALRKPYRRRDLAERVRTALDTHTNMPG
jgi:PAS domain S-box-containing protein